MATKTEDKTNDETAAKPAPKPKAEKPAPEPKEPRVTKADKIIAVFDENPLGMKLQEVALIVGCSAARVYETIKANPDDYVKIGTGLWAKLGFTEAFIGNAVKAQRAAQTVKAEDLPAGVECSVKGESGKARFRVKRVYEADNGSQIVDCWGGDPGQEMFRAFNIDKVERVFKDTRITTTGQAPTNDKPGKR